MKKTSIQDVASAAGVSLMTVTRVLRGGSVSEKTRKRVEEKIQELGYIPNQMARTLKSSKSGIIGILRSFNAAGLLHQMNESISKAVRAHGMELLTIEAEKGEEHKAIQNLLSFQVDAIILLSEMMVSPSDLELLHKLKIPVTAVERGYDMPWVDNLLVSDYETCYEIAQRILSSGHEKIALIESQEINDAPMKFNVERLRHQGFLDGLRDRGKILAEDCICTMPVYNAENGYEATKRLISSDSPPSVIFSTSDQLAAGVLQCLYDHHLRVPEDISIIGYDNVNSALFSPPIDSVALEFEKLGQNALHLTLERMEEYDRPSQTETIHTLYVDRGTLKKLDGK